MAEAALVALQSPEAAAVAAAHRAAKEAAKEAARLRLLAPAEEVVPAAVVAVGAVGSSSWPLTAPSPPPPSEQQPRRLHAAPLCHEPRVG